MNSEYQNFRDKAFSALRTLAKENEMYQDAQLLVGAAESTAKLTNQNIQRSIETDWIDEIERVLPYLDTVIRQPTIAIQDVEELLPVEVSRHINDRSVKHLAQHTNLIMNINAAKNEITPQKIMNVYRDETYLTYENKFVNTLLMRLSAFVEKRYRALAGAGGTERKYTFDYTTQFEHFLSEEKGRNTAKVTLNIELTSPLSPSSDEYNEDLDAKFADAIARISRINSTLIAYQSSVFAQKLGRNYVRPPVIRTNAILKNKNMKECLKLWEYIESFDKVGYTVRIGEDREMPSEDYIGDLYATVALQYVHFYNGVSENDGNRMLSKKLLFDTMPDFNAGDDEEELKDYLVHDAEYKKTTPTSRHSDKKQKLSKDERRIAEALLAALRAEEILEQKRREEEEKRRAEEARLRAEEEARIRAEEEKRRAEEARLLAEEEKRRAEAEALRLAEEEAKRREEEERQRAEEARQQEWEEKRLAEEENKRREEEEKMLAEMEKRREAEALRKQKEAEALRLAEEERAREMAEAWEAKKRAEDIYAPEDGDYTGRFPLCPYTRKQYVALSRKKKKQVKYYMDQVVAYRDAQKLISALWEADADNFAKITELKQQCEAIKKELSREDGWHSILKYHKV